MLNRLGQILLATVLIGGIPLYGQTCGLEMLVLGPSQIPVPHKVSIFRAASGGENLAERFSALQIEGIPCGNYEFEVRSTFPDPEQQRDAIKGQILLLDRHQHWTLHTDPRYSFLSQGVFYQDSTDPKYTLRGRVANLAPSTQARWVRLYSLNTNTVREVQLEAEGTFEFLKTRGAEEYLFVVMSPTELIAAKRIGFNIRFKGEPVVELTILPMDRTR
jgi:hypothetical protein